MARTLHRASSSVACVRDDQTSFCAILLRKNLDNPTHDESRLLYPIIGTPRPDFQTTKAAFGTQKCTECVAPGIGSRNSASGS
jgi:hypothetical protein